MRWYAAERLKAYPQGRGLLHLWHGQYSVTYPLPTGAGTRRMK